MIHLTADEGQQIVIQAPFMKGDKHGAKQEPPAPSGGEDDSG